MSVRIIDVGVPTAEVLRRIRKIAGSIHVGVAPVEHPSGKTAAEIGLIHEMGLGVPKRSFIRSWVDTHLKETIAHLKALVLENAQVTTAEKLWQKPFGEYCVKGIQEHIRTNIPPPLAEETVKRKGHDLALVDTETLINAIVWEQADR